MLNIGRGRRREHPMDTSKGVTVTTCCATSGCAHSREPLRGQVTIGSHVTTTKKKKHGKNPGMRRTYFRSGPLPDRASSSHVTDVTSGEKAPLSRIWCNFRLRMRITYFRTGHVTYVTSGHVTSGSIPAQHHRKYGFVRAHILLAHALFLTCLPISISGT